MTLDQAIVEALADELYEKYGRVVVGAYGERRVYKLDEELMSLWGQRVLRPWVVVGFLTVGEYSQQIERIRSLRPDWPQNYAVPKQGSYYEAIPRDDIEGDENDETERKVRTRSALSHDG